MSPFRYKLQKVLDLMEKREKQVDAEVLAAKARRDAEADALRAITVRQSAAQKGLQAQMAQGATPDVASSNDYIQALGLRAEAQAKRVKEAEQVLEVATKKQMEVRRDRQRIEKHKDMKRVLYQVEEKAKEAKRIDEMAGTMFMKKRQRDEEALTEEQERLEKLEKLKLLKALREKREEGYR
jgi:flagellar export protein FliJ